MLGVADRKGRAVVPTTHVPKRSLGTRASCRIDLRVVRRHSI